MLLAFYKFCNIFIIFILMLMLWPEFMAHVNRSADVPRNMSILRYFDEILSKIQPKKTFQSRLKFRSLFGIKLL